MAHSMQLTYQVLLGSANKLLPAMQSKDSLSVLRRASLAAPFLPSYIYCIRVLHRSLMAIELNNIPGLPHENTWLIAIRQCEQELDPNIITDIKQFTRPGALLDYIEERQRHENRSKLRRLLNKASGVGSRFEKYQHALDLMAQGTPMPGCLIWGSITLALKVELS